MMICRVCVLVRRVVAQQHTQNHIPNQVETTRLFQTDDIPSLQLYSTLGKIPFVPSSVRNKIRQMSPTVKANRMNEWMKEAIITQSISSMRMGMLKRDLGLRLCSFWKEMDGGLFVDD
mmetsp:Transcript_18274/g.27124  ORF Transcript_18274/g.27124 Transcript_18274/m.27124 type:complete len:118 (-) Transcript_18274:129-482(-)